MESKLCVISIFSVRILDIFEVIAKFATLVQDETKIVGRKSTMPSKDRRGTFTVAKGKSVIKRDETKVMAPPTPVPEDVPPPEPECRFKLDEPPPSSIKIEPMNLIEHKDLDELLEPPPPLEYKYKERNSKMSEEGKFFDIHILYSFIPLYRNFLNLGKYRKFLAKILTKSCLFY